MAKGLYVVVTKGTKPPVERMTTKADEAEALAWIAKVGIDDGDPRTVERVFYVSSVGLVTHYHIVFDGKLKLEEIPSEGRPQS